MNLNDTYFKSRKTSANAEVSRETVFHYRQKNNIVWATYEGGDILFGTLSGRREDNLLKFTYQHQNLNGEFKTGKCVTIVKLLNSKIHLIEEWQWTCDDRSKGTSELEEVNNVIDQQHN